MLVVFVLLYDSLNSKNLVSLNSKNLVVCGYSVTLFFEKRCHNVSVSCIQYMFHTQLSLFSNMAKGKTVNVKNTEVSSLFSLNLKSPLPAFVLSKGVAGCTAEAGMLKQGSISSGNSSFRV